MTSTEGVELAGRQRHLPTLTGLRFVAAFVVFIGHAARLTTEGHQRALHWLTGGSHTGVGFFFLLSGFVLMWTARCDDRPTAFYRRRFARIYPSHLLTWIAGLLFFSYVVDVSPSHKGALLGVFLLQAWSPDQSIYYAVNGVAWSLSAEFFFYLTFPLYASRLLMGSARTRRLLGAGALIGLVALTMAAAGHIPTDEVTGLRVSGVWMWLIYQAPAVRVIEFFLGAVLAVEVHNGLRLPSWSYRASLALSALAYLWTGLQPSAYSIVLMTLLPFLLLVAAASRDLAGRRTLFARSWSVRLGEWSFAFYLLHQMVTHTVQYTRPPLSSYLLWVLESLGLLALSTALAYTLHRFVERPAELRLRGRAARPARGEVLPAVLSGTHLGDR